MAAPQYQVTLIDDDPALAQMVSVLARLDGRLEVTTSYRSAVEALESPALPKADAIVCDVDMPGLSGLDALPRLRALCPYAAIVMYTADPEKAQGALDHGADEVVDKMDDPSGLLDVIARILADRHGRQSPA